MKLLLLATFLTALSIPGVSSGQSLEDISRLEQIEDTIELIDKAEIALESATRARRTDCLKAVGSQPFCSCISNKLAVAWSFADYVSITTRSKEENGYSQLSGDLRTAYDNVAGVRDECVATSVAP